MRKNKFSFLSNHFVPFERILILEELYHYLHIQDVSDDAYSTIPNIIAGESCLSQ